MSRMPERRISGHVVSRVGRLLLVCWLALATLLISTPRLVLAASFTVNSTGDAADANPGNGICETATAGVCTLRAAIQEANALAGPDTIQFTIAGAGVQTISPASALPNVVGPVTIDGLSQPGASCAAWPPTLLIELNGTGTPGGTSGLLTAGAVTIRGLVINRFPGNGLFVFGSGATV